MALILAKPGPLRDSLRAFLLTLPQVKEVRFVNDAPSALEVVSEINPDLVLIDADLSGGEALTAVRRIRGDDPHSRCLVLADDMQQQRDAAAAGADVALLKGCRATELFDAIEKLLLPPHI
jgi:DNA-binding NarL/FixJ family response regulator